MEHMKAIRKQKGITVEEHAEKCGITSTMIWNYESGRRTPPLDTLCAIADALDVSLDMLVRGKEKDRPEERSFDDMVRTLKKLTPEEADVLVALASLLQYRRQFPSTPGQDSPKTP